MRKHAWRFVVAFIPTAIVAGGLVLARQPMWALVVGAAGLILHWAWSRDSDSGGELADASYFFGFLLTLTFLAAGLSHIAAIPKGQDSSTAILGFLNELGAGLALTILGLVVRQARTLSRVSGGAPGASDSLTEAQTELASAMRVLVRALQSRPEEVAARDLQETRTRARQTAERVESDIQSAAAQMTESMRRLESAANEVSATLLRAGSGLGNSLTSSVERIQIEVTAAVTMLETQRKELETTLCASHEMTEDVRRRMMEQMDAQLAAWRGTLDVSRQSLAEANASLGGEYREGLVALETAGTAFVTLAQRVSDSVTALPNPADRLVGLWDGVGALETKLATSVESVSQGFAALDRQANGASGAMARLSGSTEAAAKSIENGGAELGDALKQELKQMNEVLDEYTQLLERNIAGAR